jgi:vacuolar-type H+-ATPase subunit I/STV1
MGSSCSSCCKPKQDKPLFNLNCKDNQTNCCITRPSRQQSESNQILDLLNHRLDNIESELRRQASKIHDVEKVNIKYQLVV